MALETTNDTQFRESILRRVQQCLEAVPAIILGSGFSAAHEIRGMGPLADYLSHNVTVSEEHQQIWQAFSDVLAETRDLEVTLQRVTIPPPVLKQVIHHTRVMVMEDDREVFRKLLVGDISISLVALFSHLFRSTSPTITVVTTNYDRLAEYSADLVSHTVMTNTGFAHGYRRRFLPLASTFPVRKSRQPRTVDVWKVHGSLDWFSAGDGTPLALPFAMEYPAELQPLLVTPGVSKYEMTHQEPFRTIITNADIALQNARGFLSVGFGFNDEHIQPKLVRRASEMQVPVVILARTLREGAKKFISHCKHDRVLGLEKAGAGTRAYTAELPDGVVLPNSALWDLDALLKEAITQE